MKIAPPKKARLLLRLVLTSVKPFRKSARPPTKYAHAHLADIPGHAGYHDWGDMHETCFSMDDIDASIDGSNGGSTYYDW